MSTKAVYVFFATEGACLAFADEHAERILHMGYRTFDPFADTNQGMTESDDCTNKGDWFVRIQLDSNYNGPAEETKATDSSTLKTTAASRKRRGGV